jgi:hypothetical protein
MVPPRSSPALIAAPRDSIQRQHRCSGAGESGGSRRAGVRAASAGRIRFATHPPATRPTDTRPSSRPPPRPMRFPLLGLLGGEWQVIQTGGIRLVDGAVEPRALCAVREYVVGPLVGANRHPFCPACLILVSSSDHYRHRIRDNVLAVSRNGSPSGNHPWSPHSLTLDFAGTAIPMRYRTRRAGTKPPRCL